MEIGVSLTESQPQPDPLDFLSDNVLMLKVKSGDLDKLGLLFRRYGKSLYGFYFRFTRNEALSEDLVQDVFERVLKYRHTYRGDGQFNTWLYHLARNVLADQVKKNKRLGLRTDLGYQEENLVESAGPEEAMQKEEDLVHMEQALDLLSDDKKELILLSKFQGLKYKELAELLQCTEGNVKVKVFRAMQELRGVFMKIQAKGIKL